MTNDCVCKSNEIYHFGRVEYPGKNNGDQDIKVNAHINFTKKEMGIHMHKYMEYMGYSDWKDDKVCIAYCPFCGKKLV